eukprot:554763-Hanusia_phi.AAC.1
MFHPSLPLPPSPYLLILLLPAICSSPRFLRLPQPAKVKLLAASTVVKLAMSSPTVRHPRYVEKRGGQEQQEAKEEVVIARRSKDATCAGMAVMRLETARSSSS